MFLTICAYIALAVCLLGTGLRIGRWWYRSIGPEGDRIRVGRKLAGTVRAGGRVVVRPSLLWRLFRTFLLEVVLQIHIFQQDRRRWAIHICLFYGMLLLLIMHTFDDSLLSPLLDHYASTLNPWMFLRNLLGLLLLAAVGAALWRRRKVPLLRRITNRVDRLVLVLIAAIIVSGASLEAARILSPTWFNRMVDSYMGPRSQEQMTALKAFWAAEFEVRFSPAPPAKDPEVLTRGRQIHRNYCAMCHSRPVSAVLAYPLAHAFKPVSAPMERVDLHEWLYYAHFLISCLALALLPFTRLFHVIATPASLLIRSMGHTASNRPENRPVRRAIALDACTHCGVCSRHCAVAPVFQVIGNPAVLPSEKLAAVAKSVSGRNTTAEQSVLAEGSFICTECGRCTQWCPAGIDLQDLWSASGSDLAASGYPPPRNWIGRLTACRWAEILKNRRDPSGTDLPQRAPAVRLSENPDTFWACVQCATCTNVCPLVAICENPRRDLEMTPQQVMNLMRLQLREAAMGSRMVWDCLTCYKCQEHCPQGVRVADIMYELRNEACRRLGPTDASESPDTDNETGGAGVT